MNAEIFPIGVSHFSESSSPPFLLPPEVHQLCLLGIMTANTRTNQNLACIFTRESCGMKKGQSKLFVIKFIRKKIKQFQDFFKSCTCY